jgi:predicted metalloprotease with PDZ domain
MTRLRTAAPILLAAAAFTLCAAAPLPTQTMDYKLTPALTKEGKRALQVDLRFRGEADGETILELPHEWAGSSELWRQVTELEIRGAKSLGGFFDRPVIHHRPGATIRVRYKLVSAWDEDPGFDYEKARPLIHADSFFAHGEGIFSFPEGRFGSMARFRWGKIPQGWKVASDLDHLKGKKTTVANMINSVVIGGTGLRVVRRDLDGAPLRVAVLGDWSFEPDALADLVARVVSAGNGFWGDRPSPYLVAMAPLGTLRSGLSYTGTGRTDGFSIASTNAFDLKMATRFLGHEYGHSWIPNELGAMPEEQEARDYWFSEGFDDYIASKMLLRSGLWSLADYVADKNETLLRYGTSPAKTAGAAEVAERFWTDQNVQQVSYDRGHLLAAQLDAEIAARSGGTKSLDDVLRAQRKAAKGNDAAVATSLFQATLRDQTGIDLEPEVERVARRGEALMLPADLYGECARIVVERRKEFHRGYDAAATRIAGGIIAGVVPDGPAYAAGMRDGQKLIGFVSGKFGDSSTEIVYRVADENGERVLRYMPEGKAEFDVQRVELTASGPEQEAACRRRMGGGE